MARRTIELSVLDEVAAVTGERPLEQVADSSDAVGRVAVQLVRSFGYSLEGANVGSAELGNLRSIGSTESGERNDRPVALYHVNGS